MIDWLRKRLARSPPGPPAEDLALQLLQTDWRCSNCDELHHGVMDLAAFAPDPWGGDEQYEPNSALRLDGDFLSEDLCVIGGEHFFVRAILEIPVQGLSDVWAFGCWTTLSRTNFELYLDGFDVGEYLDAGPWFGWLSNHLKGIYEGDPEPVDVYPQQDRQRPYLILQNADHPLARAQYEGIEPEALLTLFRAYGHGPAEQ